MNVLIIEREREQQIKPSSVSIMMLMDFVFIDLGNGLFEVYKNRMNSIRGTITKDQARDLIQQNESLRTP